MGDAWSDEPRKPSLTALPGARLDFRAVFTEHYAFVVRTLTHFGVPASTLDDAAQEVFAIVHRRLADYDGESSVRSWLWGIARRIAATMQRGQVRAQRRLEVVKAPEPAPIPDEELERRDLIEVVEACLQRLEEPLREVFVLTEIEEFSAPEIAQALGIKLNTVYSRLRTARERFARGIARARATRERSTP